MEPSRYMNKTKTSLDKASEMVRLATKDLEAENARLRAELEALKPKPVVWEHTYHIQSINDVIKVYVKYEGGKLVKAEVIND